MSEQRSRYMASLRASAARTTETLRHCNLLSDDPRHIDYARRAARKLADTLTDLQICLNEEENEKLLANADCASRYGESLQED